MLASSQHFSHAWRYRFQGVRDEERRWPLSCARFADKLPSSKSIPQSLLQDHQETQLSFSKWYGTGETSFSKLIVFGHADRKWLSSLSAWFNNTASKWFFTQYWVSSLSGWGCDNIRSIYLVFWDKLPRLSLFFLVVAKQINLIRKTKMAPIWCGKSRV
jgi:hypothetical protein